MEKDLLEQLKKIATLANRVQNLIDRVKIRYRYEHDTRNAYLDLIEKKYRSVWKYRLEDYNFFEKGKITSFFIRMLYAYRLSSGLKNEDTFLKAISL